MSKILLAALAAAALAAPAPARQPGKARAKETSPMEWKGAYCGVSEPSHRLIGTAREWTGLWKEIGQPAPPADFAKHFAVAVFLGLRNTGGYGIVFSDPVREKSRTVVRYRVKIPQGMAIQVLTQPYAVRLYPRTDRPAFVEALPD